MSESKQRGHYRVEYPGPARPDLETGGRTFEVLDCSESGMRFAVVEGASGPEVGSEVSGIVRFKTGSSVEIHGEVSRIQDGAVAVRFVGTEVPFRTIIAEQQYLRRHFLRHLQDQG